MKRILLLAVTLSCAVGVLHAQKLIFGDDMSAFPTGWTLGTSGGHRDTWTLKTNRWHSSSASAKCTRREPPADYPDSVDVWMARSVSLTGSHMGLLNFWAWQRSEGGYDFLNFDYSTDGGTNWNTIWSRSGNYTPWREVTISNIPNTTTHIRFRFFSDPSGGDEGIYLDDVVLYGVDTTGTTVFSDNMTNFPSGWNMGAGGNNRFWGPESARFHSSNKAAQCAALDSGYYDNMASRMTRVISLPNTPYATLSFWLWYDTEDEADYIRPEYHTLGGWTPFANLTGLADYWRPHNYELPMYADSIRFRFTSDVGDNRRGAYVDDVLVQDYRWKTIDLYAVSIDSPAADIDSGATVPVRATIRNNGTVKVGLPVYLTIDDGSTYRAIGWVDSVAPSSTALVTFPDWKADVRPGVYPLKCSVAYFLDGYAGNDVKYDSVTVANTDVGVMAIQSPPALVPIGTVIPKALVRNHGNTRAAAVAVCDIPTASYRQILALPAGLPVRTDTLIEFPAWTAARGIYSVRCSVGMTGDRIRTNDQLTTSTMVGETGWTAMTEVPIGYKGRRVKDGGCLTYREAGDTGLVYAFKGNNTCEFMMYNTLANLWTTKESIPAIGSTGKKKKVKKGSALTQVDDRLYAVKGNNTTEFWEYNPNAVGYPWRQLADVPVGAKFVKEGTGFAPVHISGTNYLYFLKGSGTWEFYRYNIATNVWEALVSAPPGLSGKSFKNGSGVVYDPASNAIFTLKGSYNEFFAYSVATGAWLTKNPLPFLGRDGKKKKAKDGAGMAYANGIIYTLKGGNTVQFWVYQPTADQWAQSTDLPMGVSFRNVKGGGAITYAEAMNALYATKGNNTLEFYKYQLTSEVTEFGSGSNAAGGALTAPAALSLSVAPNPLNARTTVRYSLPRGGNARLALYDITGKLVTTLSEGLRPAGSYAVSVHQRSSAVELNSGIYVIKLETATATATAKLIVR